MTRPELVKQIAEQVYRLVADPSDESRYDIREIRLLVNQVGDELLWREYFNKLNSGEREIDQALLSSFVNVEVQTDEVRNLSYVEFPAMYVRLPNNIGVYEIAPMDNEFCPYMVCKPAEAGMLRKDPAFRAEGSNVYFVEGKKAYFIRENDDEKVLIKLICQFSDLPDDSDLPLPGDLQAQIIERVFNILRVKAPQDNINDQADKP